jgi:hypothetical protein
MQVQVEWTGSRGAAGNHVELKAGGGITVFHTSIDDGMFSSSFKLSLRWIGLDFSDLKQSVFGLVLITSGHRQRPFSWPSDAMGMATFYLDFSTCLCRYLLPRPPFLCPVHIHGPIGMKASSSQNVAMQKRVLMLNRLIS